ncbi:MAG: hypothetical protein ACR2P0_17415 [Acidimicrobiales bacterium]
MGVAALDSLEQMQAFVGYTGVGGFPNINDADGAIWASYGIGYQPAFVFVSADGVEKTFASLSGDDIQANIDSLF